MEYYVAWCKILEGQEPVEVPKEVWESPKYDPPRTHYDCFGQDTLQDLDLELD